MGRSRRSSRDPAAWWRQWASSRAAPSAGAVAFRFEATLTNVFDGLGAFKTPTLRNVAETGPFMHGGRFETLDEVLDHYAAGGRAIADGPLAGNGASSPLKDSLMTGFELSAEDREALIAFLNALTDESFVERARSRAH